MNVTATEPHSSDEAVALPAAWVAGLAAAPGVLAPTEGQATRPVGIGTDRTLTIGIPPGQPTLSVWRLGTSGAVFDGLLYNRRELARELAPEVGEGASNAEVVLRAYLRWGEECVRRLRGVFALLLWDGPGESLLALRDPLGMHPLFYAEVGGVRLFSTAIEALLAQPGVSRAVNRVALADALCNRYPNVEETFFAAVRRVPAGTVLRVDGAGVRQRRYWHPMPPEEPVRWVRDEEIEQFDELFDQAVRRCLGAGRAGIFLSGGLDSVSVAAVAADASRRAGLEPPAAFSLVFPDPDCNEEPVQRGVATALGLPHTVVPFEAVVGEAGLLSAVLETCRTWSVPLFNPWYPAYHHLSREAGRAGCTVVLTGGGGDEWLGVSPMLAADLLRGVDVVGLFRLWQDLQRSYRLPRFALLRTLLWPCGAQPLLNAAGRGLLGRVSPSALRRVRRRHVVRTTPRWIAPDPALRRALLRRAERMSCEPDPRGYYLDDLRSLLENPLVSTELEELYEGGRRTGVRTLLPYWDPDLVTFLCHTPPDLLNRGGRAKGIVRQMLARRFPHLGFERQRKVTSLSFFEQIMATQGPAAWRSLGGLQALTDLGIVEAGAVAAEFAPILAGTRPRQAHRLWDPLIFEAWLRRYS